MWFYLNFMVIVLWSPIWWPLFWCDNHQNTTLTLEHNTTLIKAPLLEGRNFMNSFLQERTGQSASYRAEAHDWGWQRVLRNDYGLTSWMIERQTAYRMIERVVNSLLIRPRHVHTSTTLCGQSVAEVWQKCGVDVAQLWARCGNPTTLAHALAPQTHQKSSRFCG